MLYGRLILQQADRDLLSKGAEVRCQSVFAAPDPKLFAAPWQKQRQKYLITSFCTELKLQGRAKNGLQRGYAFVSNAAGVE
jgi:hypothetical protein